MFHVKHRKEKMEDFKVRMIKEYIELKDKVEKCRNMLVKFYNKQLEYVLVQPIEVILMQYTQMVSYLSTLELRLELLLGDKWQNIIQETIL